MGIILSRVRKKKSTIETLEKLENEIKEIEEYRSNAQRKYKQITKLLLVYSLGLYILFGVVLYFRFNSSWEGKLLYLVPLAVSPLLLYLLNKIISWYYIRLINKNQNRLIEMRKKKKEILEEVMDKETYKVAKQILDKYSRDTLPKPSQSMQIARTDDTLRRRGNAKQPNIAQSITPMGRFAPHQPIQGMNAPVGAPRPIQGSNMPMMRLPAPIFPQDRSYIDKVFEYLIGDGPSNRYALICSRCSSHNGMALKEEFEYIGYKCCYCFFYNPARKVRPEAPKLEGPLTEIRDADTDSDSKGSGENSDGEHKTELVNTTELEESTSLGGDSNNSQNPSGSIQLKSIDLDFDSDQPVDKSHDMDLLNSEREISREEKEEDDGNDDDHGDKTEPKEPTDSEKLILSEKDENCDESLQKR